MPETVILARFNLIALLIISICSGISCNELSEFDNKQIQEALADSLLNTTESWDVRMNLIENGEKILRLEGTHAITINEKDLQETRISGPVTITIFEFESTDQSVIYCDSAIYRPDEAIFEMIGKVEVQTQQNKVLRSEYLKWERNSDKVSTYQFVIFISPPDSIAANGFTGNSDLTNYTLNEGGGQVVID